MKGLEKWISKNVVRRKEKGEITVLLSLFLLLLLIFVMAILESASIQIAKNIRRADVERAVESVFAEYQKELLREYDIFALDGTYETGSYGEDKIRKRLGIYGAVEDEAEIEGIRFLSDENGREFLIQIKHYMENRFGIDAIEDMTQKEEEIKRQEEEIKKYEEEQEKNDQMLDELLEQMPEEGGADAADGEETDNPLEILQNLKRKAIAEMVLPRDKKVSGKTVRGMDGVSVREKREGKGSLPAVGEDSTGERLYLLTYISEHFETYLKTDEERPLEYETEYLIGGQPEDMENLEIVLDKIKNIRFVPNYLYLQSDEEKKAEAKALAAVISTLLANPELIPVIQQGLLAAWAYGESIMDLRALAAGEKVPAIKTKETWKLSLSNLLKLGTSEDAGTDSGEDDGTDYEDYLKILLLMEKQDTITMRMLDLIEWNMQMRMDCPFFQADACVTRMKIQSRCRLRSGVSYHFSTYYEYR